MSLFLFLESNTFKLIRPPEGMDSLKTLLEPQSRPVLVSLDEARGCGSGCGLKCSRGCWEHRAPWRARPSTTVVSGRCEKVVLLKPFP